MGKGRIRNDSSPVDVRKGKRPNSSANPVDDVLTKVLYRIAYDKSVSEQMVFNEGVNDGNMKVCKAIKSGSSIYRNDGSFIKDHIEPVVTNVEHVVDESVRKANKDVMEGGKGNSAFVFGDVQRNKGILKKPSIGLTSVHFGPNLFQKAGSSKVWNASNVGVNIKSFAKKMKRGVEDRELQINFVPEFVSKQSDGVRRIEISEEDIKVGSKDCYLQLYGYFVGTSMDYRVVNANLSRMWRAFDIENITKTSFGIFYFKFKSEEGMKSVLESGPWMVNNVSFVLNAWEPGIWMEKVKPNTIPIWVCVYNTPMELCNGNGIGKIISGVGKPMLMDKMTKERPARIGRLDVKYQWKTPLCTHCKTFGHSMLSCKVRPKTVEEVCLGCIKELAVKTLKDALKVGRSDMGKSVNAIDDDGFVIVGKNNRPLNDHNVATHRNVSNRSSDDHGIQNKGF
ncbi:RNA-directed DNA polymerase, eukaryota, reverse transcriptase zinc-binding domain protein [Tanacetum coccineum]